MKKSRFTDSQISEALKRVEAERRRFEHLICTKRKNFLEFSGGDSGIGSGVTLLRKISLHRTRLRLVSNPGPADYDENRSNFSQ